MSPEFYQGAMELVYFVACVSLAVLIQLALHKAFDK